MPHGIITARNIPNGVRYQRKLNAVTVTYDLTDSLRLVRTMRNNKTGRFVKGFNSSVSVLSRRTALARIAGGLFMERTFRV